ALDFHQQTHRESTSPTAPSTKHVRPKPPLTFTNRPTHPYPVRLHTSYGCFPAANPTDSTIATASANPSANRHGSCASLPNVTERPPSSRHHRTISGR